MQPGKIHDFYDTLLQNVQSLETLGKTSECLSLVRGVLNKLPGMKVELVKGHQDWDFTKLLNALRELKEIHPRESVKPHEALKSPNSPGLRSFHMQEHSAYVPWGCVYCNDASYRSGECTTVRSTADHKQILQEKRPCFNCTGPHRAAHCQNQGNCANCMTRHHTSFCEEHHQEHLTDVYSLCMFLFW